MARPRAHLAISLGIAALQLWRTRRLLPAVAPILSGFLIDADHLVDYAIYRATPRGQRSRLVLPLHGWEYFGLLIWLEPTLLGPRTYHGLTLGYLLHLALDQVTNHTRSPLTYFITFRAINGFHGRYFGGRSGQHSWRDTPARRLWTWI